MSTTRIELGASIVTECGTALERGMLAGPVTVATVNEASRTAVASSSKVGFPSRASVGDNPEPGSTDAFSC
ncbi:hypothetical protein GCM10009792_08640 [Microcella alkalica]